MTDEEVSFLCKDKWVVVSRQRSVKGLFRWSWCFTGCPEEEFWALQRKGDIVVATRRAENGFELVAKLSRHSRATSFYATAPEEKETLEPTKKEVDGSAFAVRGHEWNELGRMRICDRCGARQYVSAEISKDKDKPKWIPADIKKCIPG